MVDGHPKAKVYIHSNYSAYPDQLLSELKGAHGCVWAQGISQNAVAKDEYVRITHDYPIAAAEAMSSLSDNFNFVYVSGEGADPTEKSRTFFGKIKGRTETALLALSSPHPSLNVFNVRPAYVDPTQSSIPTDRKRKWYERSVDFLAPVMRTVIPSMVIPSDKLGEYLVKLALSDGSPREKGDGIEAEGRTVRNWAIRDALDL